MLLTTESYSNATLVTVLENRIDAASAIAFKDQMREIVNAGSQRVIIDLAKVDFIDSSGLGAVVAVMKLLGPDQTMELTSLSDTVQKVFQLTRMDTIFTIHPNTSDATEGLRATG